MAKILIIKPSAIGDIIHTLPFYTALRKYYPDARISWLVNSSYADLIVRLPGLDEVILFQRERWGKKRNTLTTLFEFAAMMQCIRERKFDMVIDLQCLLRTGIITGLSGARCRIGFKTGREFSPRFYNVKIDVPEDTIHAIDRYMLIARRLGIEPGPYEFPLSPAEEDMQYVDSVFFSNVPDQKPVVGINPCAKWPTKRWQEIEFARLGDMVANRLGAMVIITGGKEDVPRAKRIQSMMHDKPVIAAGRTDLSQLIALFKRLDIFVTNDTGPMHLAAALKVPVVAIFGPTDPRRTGPYGTVHTVLKGSLDCNPCFKRQCNNPTCMNAITAEEVFEAVRNKRVQKENEAET